MHPVSRERNIEEHAYMLNRRMHHGHMQACAHMALHGLFAAGYSIMPTALPKAAHSMCVGCIHTV